MDTSSPLLLLALLFFALSSAAAKDVDLSLNLHKNLRSKSTGPKPVEKATSPYFVKILKRRPNYVIEANNNDAEVEALPRILKTTRRFPILAKGLDSEENDTKNDSSDYEERMEEASSTLSGSTTTFLPLLGQLISTATNSNNDTQQAPSTQQPPTTQPPTADREPSLPPSFLQDQSTTTTSTTTTTTTTTAVPTTVTTTTPTTTTTTTSTTSRANIRLVQTNQIEVLTFPSTRRPTSARTTTATWTFFEPKKRSEEKNPLDVILSAPGNFLVGMFKGFQQATEFVGDTISGFANLFNNNNNNNNRKQ